LTSYLKKSAPGKYTYDVVMNLKKTSGETIKKDFLLNTDGINAEHGFVSMIPNAIDGFFVTWLDGRYTVGEEMEGHHKAMTVRVAEIAADGTIYNEHQLDGKVCDCCQTSINMSQQGPIVVYRDRSNEEIRDIYIKNDFYDFDLKFALFGTFAEYYKKQQKQCNKTNCLTEKKILLGAIQEMIYSDKPFLPSDEVLEIINTINYFEEIDELKQKDIDTHIGAES